MGRKLFVGNLPYDVNEDDLRDFISAAGHAPVKITVPVDKSTRRPRGFAFVEFESQQDAEKAMGDLDSMQLLGRKLRVDVAQERR